MANKPVLPDMSKYINHKVCLSVQKSRTVRGVLNGYDPFMNVVLDSAVAHNEGQSASEPGETLGQVVIRGCTIESVTLIPGP
eukprot:NODE_9536_length_470_cov_14.403800_g8447_i0.p1 GENE.NODE_9536_length_470_cov_14.403800_g8447_i0~~NODE_9536_length_470_cov_14.403800_g8447_i0.p1  ORF type:complete len:82 (-),score=2.87 NODE_9536_length_470_cov_14.403800_g8447_i0:84-329(-)